MANGKRAVRAARRIGVETDADFEGRRMIIVREAARAFAEKGVKDTSIDDIAKRLGVTKPALYHYISGKDKIVAAVLRFSEQRMENIVKEAREIGGSGLDRLRFVMRELGRNAVDEFSRCMFAIDPNSVTDDVRESSRKMQSRFVHGVTELIQEGIADGSIRDADPRVMAFTLLGAVLNLTRWYRHGGSLSIAAVTEQMLQIVESGVRAP